MTFKEELGLMIKSGDFTKHNILQYKLTYTNILATFNELRVSKDYLVEFGACDNLFFTYANSGAYVQYFTLSLPTDYVARYNKLKEVTEYVLLETKNMSNLEKVLYVHDYLCYKTAYDTAYKVASGYIYSTLILEKGLCFGYSQVLEYFLKMFGLNFIEIKGNNGSHVWIQVEIDGCYYHIDATWDDPMNDVRGRVWHKNFMLNDAEIKATGHYGWTEPTILTYGSQTVTIPKEFKVSTSTKYSTWFVKSIIGRMIYNDGNWIFVNSKKLMSITSADLVNNNLANTKVLLDIQVNSACKYNNQLIYSSGKKIYTCDINGQYSKLILEANDTTVDKLNIVDYLYVDKDNLTYTTYSYNDNGTIITKISTTVNLLNYDMKIEVPVVIIPTPVEIPIEEIPSTDILDFDPSDLSNWKTGLYNWTTGEYTSYPTRICLNEYKTFSDTLYTFEISDSGFKILIRELDVDKKFISTTTISNLGVFKPKSNTKYLAVSLYHPSEVSMKLTFDSYKILFANGFKIIIK